MPVTGDVEARAPGQVGGEPMSVAVVAGPQGRAGRRRKVKAPVTWPRTPRDVEDDFRRRQTAARNHRIRWIELTSKAATDPVAKIKKHHNHNTNSHHSQIKK